MVTVRGCKRAFVEDFGVGLGVVWGGGYFEKLSARNAKVALFPFSVSLFAESCGFGNGAARLSLRSGIGASVRWTFSRVPPAVFVTLGSARAGGRPLHAGPGGGRTESGKWLPLRTYHLTSSSQSRVVVSVVARNNLRGEYKYRGCQRTKGKKRTQITWW